ncbi:acetoacetate decarboxylase family protein [Sphingomonadaceae bacterium jetA1]|jgi:acetoacetate decarboxylase|uniref:acetoacetate decarboxylase family protein n=1 Tax=Facivitalis istanbulensis TaxID=3075838 RepID=UPI003496A94F
MPVELDPSRRYDMPASFGPSSIPARTQVKRAESLVLSAVTDRTAVERLVPAHFTVPEAPSLTVAHMAYHDIDYLGGRSYNEVVVSVSARHDGGGQAIAASLALVLWVDQPGALIAGREFMGLPKILGRISDLEDRPDGVRFTCAEYDVPLLVGSATGWTPLDQDRLARLNGKAADVQTFGWKYIAAAGGGSDVDHPLVNSMRWSYEQAWTGQGDFLFHPVAFADAPLSAAAARQLAMLPVTGPVRAFRGIGQATIDRAATRRIGHVGGV